MHFTLGDFSESAQDIISKIEFENDTLKLLPYLPGINELKCSCP